ncbi:hypothetical protein D9M71_369120 [compost metagenome]
MQVRATAAEHLAEAVAGGNDQHEQHQAQQARALAQRRVAEEVVDEPAGDQRTDTDGDTFTAAQGAARGQQVQGRVPVEHQAQQGNTRHPGEIGFPFEPVQVLRHFRRSQLVFFQVVDTATVNRPEVARQAIARVGPVEVVFQPDKVERRADPGHASDHMNPAHAQVQPFQQMCFHSLYLSPVTLLSSDQTFSYWWGARIKRSSSLKKCSSQLLPVPLRSTTRKSSRFSIVSTGWCQTPRW